MKRCKGAVKSRQKEGKIAEFRDCEFVEHMAKTANDLIYSKKVLNSTRTTPKPKISLEDQKRLPPPNSKKKSFVTNMVKDPNSSLTNTDGSSHQNKNCWPLPSV